MFLTTYKWCSHCNTHNPEGRFRNQLRKRVAVVEQSDQLGGAALRAGTISSKALREASLALTGAAHTGPPGDKT